MTLKKMKTIQDMQNRHWSVFFAVDAADDVDDDDSSWPRAHWIVVVVVLLRVTS